MCGNLWRDGAEGDCGKALVLELELVEDEGLEGRGPDGLGSDEVGRLGDALEIGHGELAFARRQGGEEEEDEDEAGVRVSRWLEVQYGECNEGVRDGDDGSVMWDVEMREDAESGEMSSVGRGHEVG